MKSLRYFFSRLLLNMLVVLVIAYALVTARSFFDPWNYFQERNFVPLLFVTVFFMMAYNTSVQLCMYFWYRWDMPIRPSYLRLLFLFLLITIFFVVLLTFIQFAMGLKLTSIWDSGYLTVELPLFTLFFAVCPAVSIRYPNSNPWIVLFSFRDKSQPAQTIELYHKQEILHVPLSDIVLFHFIRKKCICICIQGRQLSTSKLNSERFAVLQDSDLFMQTKRSVFVQRKLVEGYTNVGRHKYIHFTQDIQRKVNRVLNDPNSHATGWNIRERLTPDICRISPRYLREVLAQLQQK